VLATAIGSHILSCGGTLLLAPLFPALAGTGATANMWLATSANLLGITLVLLAINRTSKDMIKILFTDPA
jgi:hypothetical protein